MNRKNALAMFVVLMGGIAVGAVLMQHLDSRAPGAGATAGDALVNAVAPAIAVAAPLPLPEGSAIAEVADRVTPSVVSVFSKKEIKVPDYMQFPFGGSPFHRFFGIPPGMEPDLGQPAPGPGGGWFQQGLGSGVIISADGLILTNNHVVAQADEIKVELSDERQLEAEVVGTDPKSDIAVIRVKEKNLPAIAVADSSRVRVGEVVLAIGSPFGLSHSVTMGIISAIGRANVGIIEGGYEDFLQTDAAINPGNSGGALVNMRGELVGINTAIASRSGGYQGIGFAIPSSMAMSVKDSLLKHGRVIRGWLGVAIQNLTPELAENMGVKARHGVLISDVTRESPAQKSGLRRGDIVLKIDGKATNEVSELRNLIAMKGKGATVRLSVLRDNREREIAVELGELVDDQAAVGTAPAEGKQEQGLLSGLTVRNLDPATRRKHDLPAETRGVLVTEVRSRSPAARSGLRPGDIVVEVNRSPTPDVEAFRKAAASADQRVLLLIDRDGNTIFLALSR
ncbi:MAG: DegQ family serine endoprotease [Deltaproteobacteria bacterium]|nr:DegQ family serine endoprotease [Deltaproteobacteria bacterium]